MIFEKKIPVLGVVGPTASGKTRLAVELALRLNGEVVSADSMQVYKGMDVGTAKPTAEEMRGVPHHMIGVAEQDKSFSVADYTAMAGTCIREIRSRGKLPVLAGGTGLYVRSLLQNLQFTPIPTDADMRRELTEQAQTGGAEALLAELRVFDPESAARIDPSNLPRLVRAVELYRLTGITMTEHLARSHAEPTPYESFLLGLNFRDRQLLYERIGLRVDEMLAAGLEREARQVLAGEHAKTALQAIGYKEFSPYLRGECAREEAVENIKRETRRYAKRQLTWFRKDPVEWLEIDGYPDFSALANHAEQLARAWLANAQAVI